MEIARTVALVLGVLLVLITAWSVFTSLVVPRASSSRLQTIVGRVIAGGARLLSPKLPTYEARDRMLSLVGPATMVSLFGLWLGLLVIGFALILWWSTGLDLATALGISGSSVFT